MYSACCCNLWISNHSPRRIYCELAAALYRVQTLKNFSGKLVKLWNPGTKSKLKTVKVHRTFSQRGVVWNIGHQIWGPAWKLPGEKSFLCDAATRCVGTKVTSTSQTVWMGETPTSTVGTLVTQQPAHKWLWVKRWQQLESTTWGLCVRWLSRSLAKFLWGIITTTDLFGLKTGMDIWFAAILDMPLGVSPARLRGWSTWRVGTTSWEKCRSWWVQRSRLWLTLKTFRKTCSFLLWQCLWPRLKWSISLTQGIGFYASIQRICWNRLWWDRSRNERGALCGVFS